MLSDHPRPTREKVTLPGGPTRNRSIRRFSTLAGAGTNENTNCLIREYFPKETEITGDINYLWAVADSLNDRPRATLGFRKPNEVFAELSLHESVSSPA